MYLRCNSKYNFTPIYDGNCVLHIVEFFNVLNYFKISLANSSKNKLFDKNEICCKNVLIFLSIKQHPILISNFIKRDLFEVTPSFKSLMLSSFLNKIESNKLGLSIKNKIQHYPDFQVNFYLLGILLSVCAVRTEKTLSHKYQFKNLPLPKFVAKIQFFPWRKQAKWATSCGNSRVRSTQLHSNVFAKQFSRLITPAFIFFSRLNLRWRIWKIRAQISLNISLSLFPPTMSFHNSTVSPQVAILPPTLTRKCTRVFVAYI